MSRLRQKLSDRNRPPPVHAPAGTARYAPAYPRRAASIVAMSIFFIFIIASNARLAAARSELVVASSNTRGVICQ